MLWEHEIDEEAWGKKKKPWRCRRPDSLRDEVLARLLALNAPAKNNAPAQQPARLSCLEGGRRKTSTMTHPADFADAHRRHWQDAELLFAHERWSNSDQLYGFSAECGLKAVMKALGMPVVDKGMPSESKYREHVRELWPLFMTFAADRDGARTCRCCRAASRSPTDRTTTATRTAAIFGNRT